MHRPTKVVCFDAFGTLVHIANRTHPESVFREFLEQEGAGLSHSVALDLMARNKTWGEIFQDKNVDPPPSVWRQWQERQKEELKSIQLYPETWDVLNHVASCGWAIGVVSNLGSPYDVALRPVLELVKQQHPSIEVAWALSFEVGAVKPQAEIFQHIMQQFPHLPASAFYMMGDKAREDVKGPKALGWNACHLQRPAMTLWECLEDMQLSFLKRNMAQL